MMSLRKALTKCAPNSPITEPPVSSVLFSCRRSTTLLFVLSFLLPFRGRLSHRGAGSGCSMIAWGDLSTRVQQPTDNKPDLPDGAANLPHRLRTDVDHGFGNICSGQPARSSESRSPGVAG